jgi:hypothetical protein
MIKPKNLLVYWVTEYTKRFLKNAMFIFQGEFLSE